MFWLVIYTQTWSAVPFTVFSEISSQDLREKVIALGAIMNQCVSIVIIFVSPYIQVSCSNGAEIRQPVVDRILFSEFPRRNISGKDRLHLCRDIRRGIPLHLLLRARPFGLLFGAGRPAVQKRSSSGFLVPGDDFCTRLWLTTNVMRQLVSRSVKWVFPLSRMGLR